MENIKPMVRVREFPLDQCDYTLRSHARDAEECREFGAELKAQEEHKTELWRKARLAKRPDQVIQRV